MGKREINEMTKELLVAGLDKYEWSSLSTPQLLMIVRIIDSMETVKKESADNYSLSDISLASNSVGIT